MVGKYVLHILRKIKFYTKLLRSEVLLSAVGHSGQEPSNSHFKALGISLLKYHINEIVCNHEPIFYLFHTKH